MTSMAIHYYVKGARVFLDGFSRDVCASLATEGSYEHEVMLDGYADAADYRDTGELARAAYYSGEE